MPQSRHKCMAVIESFGITHFISSYGWVVQYNPLFRSWNEPVAVMEELRPPEYAEPSWLEGEPVEQRSIGWEICNAVTMQTMRSSMLEAGSSAENWSRWLTTGAGCASHMHSDIWKRPVQWQKLKLLPPLMKVLVLSISQHTSLIPGRYNLSKRSLNGFFYPQKQMSSFLRRPTAIVC